MVPKLTVSLRAAFLNFFEKIVDGVSVRIIIEFVLTSLEVNSLSTILTER